MKNCLVEKLNGSVDNYLLPEIGCLKVAFKAGYTKTFTFNGMSAAYLYKDDGTLMQTASTGTIAPSGQYAGYLLVKKAPGMIKFGATGVSASDRVELIDIKAINLKDCSLNMLSVYNSNFEDSISNIVAYCPLLTILNLQATYVYGNLEDLLNGSSLKIPLTNLNVIGCYNIKAKRSTVTTLEGLISKFDYNGIDIDENA